jgi:hypothetical protein
MGEREFDYYIFVDYSEDLIGYIILKNDQIKDCLSRASKLKHYKGLKQKKLYLQSMKNSFDKNEILRFLEKHRITELRQNIELCSEIFEFCKDKNNSNIFISVDDRQYKGFMKLLNVLDGKRFTIVKEGKLKKHSLEYRLSLIIDTLLNLKRTRK